MTPETKHFVTFYSPGSFFAETTSKSIDSWDPKKAVEMAETIVERYGARPYCFVFHTELQPPPVTSKDGQVFKVESKTTDTSGRFYLGAKVEKLSELEDRKLRSEDILRSNMRGNGYPVMASATKGYDWTQPFESGDVVVDAMGAVVRSGDDPDLKEYREATLAAWQAEKWK